MAKAEWGTKRQCPKCGTRFYDLGNDDPIVCVGCGHQFHYESLLKSRRPRDDVESAEERKKAAAALPQEEEEFEEEKEIDVDVDEDEEVLGIEEEDEDMADVIQTKVEDEED